MGQLDQFAKILFDEETRVATGGALTWDTAAELPLIEVRLDGLLHLVEPTNLAALPPPWSLASGSSDIVAEIKMQGDHADASAFLLALLRRSAWAATLDRTQAERAWHVDLWIIHSHLPSWCHERTRVVPLSTGCYRLECALGHGVWIAANELPLDESLIPFLVARSRRSLVEFARWVTGRRPSDWVTRMLEYLPMTPAERNEILRYIQPTKDPERLQRRKSILTELARQVVEDDPDGLQDVMSDLPDAMNAQAGRLLEARRAVLRIIERRDLPLAVEQRARIEGCGDLTLLERWLDLAIVAGSVDEVLA